MNTTPSFGVGCSIIAEFDDDASSFAEAELEFVPVQPIPVSAVSALLAGTVSQPLSGLPSEEAVVAAKKYWLRVIRRFTEPVPGKKGHLRVRDAEEPDQGVIIVEDRQYIADAPKTEPLHRRWFSGHALDVADKLCLILFGKKEPIRPGGDSSDPCWVTESIIPIPWGEIANVRFEIRRLVQSKPKPAATA